MDHDILQYDQIVEEALRGVVRTSLAQVSAMGLPEGHSLYITFRTEAPDVQIANRLRETYPEEMTIDLENQFWDLQVDEDQFSVTLSFDRRKEVLIVPFQAIVSFADPSVPFGLKFEIAEHDGDLEPEAEQAQETASGVAAGQDKEAVDPGGDDEDNDERTGEVVNLDQFRKK